MAAAAKEGRYHKVDGKTWKDSPAKAMLILDIKNGKVKQGDSAAEVQESREEYMKWPGPCFRNNLNNLLKKHAKGESPFDVKDSSNGAPSPSTPASKKGGAGEGTPGTPGPKDPPSVKKSSVADDDVDDATAGIASMGMLSRDDDDDDEFKTGIEDNFSMIPDEIQVGSLRMHRVVFPLLQVLWEDNLGRKRITLVVHLPSGSYRRDFIKYKVLGHEQKVLLFFDWSKFRILDPIKYGKAFNDDFGRPLYSDGDTKVVAFKRKIRKLKGRTAFDPVKSVFEIELGYKCINRVTDAEGYKGFQILKMDEEAGKAPQVFCHMELMGVAHGHYTPAIDDVQDYLSSDDDDDSQEEKKDNDDEEAAEAAGRAHDAYRRNNDKECVVS